MISSKNLNCIKLICTKSFCGWAISSKKNIVFLVSYQIDSMRRKQFHALFPWLVLPLIIRLKLFHRCITIDNDSVTLRDFSC